MNPDEIIAAVEAFKRDGRVMVRARHAGGNEEWVETMHPVWNFIFYDYAPCPPAPREIWVNIYGGPMGYDMYPYPYPTEEAARNAAKKYTTARDGGGYNVVESDDGYVGTFLFRQVPDDV